MPKIKNARRACWRKYHVNAFFLKESGARSGWLLLCLYAPARRRHRLPRMRGSGAEMYVNDALFITRRQEEGAW